MGRESRAAAKTNFLPAPFLSAHKDEFCWLSDFRQDVNSPENRKKNKQKSLIP